MKLKTIFSRIILIIILIIPIVYWRDFFFHFEAYLTGNVITHVITKEWKIVVISIFLFLLFLIPLSFRRKANWVEYGLVGAFFVSLFIEMYGIPFTILFASKYFLSPDIVLPNNVIEFSFLGTSMGMDLAMFYGAILMIIGSTLIIVAWITLYYYAKTNQKTFVQSGIYGYSRHPQYFGFILIILGWFIGWPTILTIIFAPILIYKYISVCLTEEKEMANLYPNYQEYLAKTPFMI